MSEYQWPIALTVTAPWMVEWARAICEARVHEVHQSELTFGARTTHLEAAIAASLRRKVGADIDDYCAKLGLVVLSGVVVEEQVRSGAIVVRARFLACERQAVPPVEDWAAL